MAHHSITDRTTYVGSRYSIDDEEEDTTTQTKISGWQSLRNRLEAGTLMKDLRRMGGPKASSKYTGGGGGTFNAKLLILQAKSQHEAEKAKQKERHEKRMMNKKRKKLEKQLMDQAFPTIMGFYFDGFFTKKFKLNKMYAEKFNELEVEISKKKEEEYKETFIEKAKRNFWPPRVIGGMMFRTRGVYLDFKEILKDPPRTPPEIIIDPRLLTNDKEIDKLQQKLDEIEAEEARQKSGGVREKVVRTGPRTANDFYFSEGRFHIKDLDKVYYKDKKTGVWKANRNEDIDVGDLVPQSYYFDAEEGVFKFKSSNERNQKPKKEMSMFDKLKAKKNKAKARVAPTATSESEEVAIAASNTSVSAKRTAKKKGSQDQEELGPARTPPPPDSTEPTTDNDEAEPKTDSVDLTDNDKP